MDNSASVNITDSGDGSVTGTFSVTDQRAADDGFLPPSILFTHAESLLEMSSAVAQNSAMLVDSSAQFINLTYCESINAEAKLIDHRCGFAAWEVKLFDPDNAEIARIKFSYVSQKAAPVKRIETVAETGDAQRIKGANKRDAIATAACGVIAEKGFAAATMRQIAAAANMHVPTMYQYVRSKEEVLVLVYRTEISRVRENVREALASDLPPMEKLLGIAASFVRGNGTMRKEAGVLNRELRSLSHQARRQVLADYAELMDEVAQVISDGAAAGQMRDVEAELVANMIDAICDLWALRPFALAGVQEEVFLKQALTFIENGLRKP